MEVHVYPSCRSIPYMYNIIPDPSGSQTKINRRGCGGEEGENSGR